MSLKLNFHNKDSSAPAVSNGEPVIIADISDRAIFSLRKAGDLQRVTITDIDMPIGSMCRFMVKWAIASIPAFIILSILGMVLAAVFIALSHM